MTIEEIKNLPDQANIYSVSGKLTKVYPPRTGESAKGPWKIQNCMLQDDTGEIKLVVMSHEDDVPESLVGKDVTIESYQGQKGWSGVYAHQDHYTKKDGEEVNARVIKITKTGKIRVSDSPTKPSARTDASGGSTQREPEQTAFTKPGFHQELARIQNALYFIKEAVKNQNENSKINGIETPDAQRQAEIMSTFIKMDRMGLINELPIEPVWKTTTPAPYEDEIPS